MKIHYASMAMLAGFSVLCNSCVAPAAGYATYSVPAGGGVVSAGVAWTNASYDDDGFPIFGYSYGRPVYGYTSAGAAIFTIAALTALCFVPHWAPASWYHGPHRYPAGIHRVAAPPRFPSGHRPGVRPPSGIKPPPAPSHRGVAPKPHNNVHAPAPRPAAPHVAHNNHAAPRQPHAAPAAPGKQHAAPAPNRAGQHAAPAPNKAGQHAAPAPNKAGQLAAPAPNKAGQHAAPAPGANRAGGVRTLPAPAGGRAIAPVPSVSSAGSRAVSPMPSGGFRSSAAPSVRPMSASPARVSQGSFGGSRGSMGGARGGRGRR